jgi:hypothetical protein
MTRYYLDSNIYRLLKPSHPHHRADVKRMLEEVHNELLIFYSDAHFDDLKDSKPEYRDKDLEVIHLYAGAHYFTVDYQHNLKYLLVDPLTAFYEKDYAAADQFVGDPTNLDSILGSDSDPLVASLKGVLNSFFSLPIGILNPNALNTAEVPLEHQDMLNRMIPAYSPSMSLKDFWGSSMAYSTKMMGDENEMGALRKYVAAYLDKDHYSWDKWKTQFNVKFRETTLGKTFKELVDSMLLDQQKQNLWLKISYLYTLLEMYGITQERVGKKNKKNSMSDLFKDANHVFYASFTDYLVTEDKGMQLKAHIIYQLMGYSTEVLSADELLAKKQQLLFKETQDSFLTALEYDMEHSLQIYKVPDLLNGNDTSTHKSTIPYFDYFNRFQMRPGNKEFSFFAIRKAPRANFVMYHELRIITDRLLQAFGADDENKGAYQLSEKSNGGDLRIWTKDRLEYTLSIFKPEAKSFIMLTLILKNK